MLILRLLLILQFLLFGGKLWDERSLFNFANLLDYGRLAADAFLHGGTAHQDTIDEALEGLGEGLLAAMLQLKVGQIFVQLLDLCLPFGLVLAEGGLKVKTVFAD